MCEPIHSDKMEKDRRLGGLLVLDEKGEDEKRGTRKVKQRGLNVVCTISRLAHSCARIMNIQLGPGMAVRSNPLFISVPPSHDPLNPLSLSLFALLRFSIDKTITLPSISFYSHIIPLFHLFFSPKFSPSANSSYGGARKRFLLYFFLRCTLALASRLLRVSFVLFFLIPEKQPIEKILQHQYRFL